MPGRRRSKTPQQDTDKKTAYRMQSTLTDRFVNEPWVYASRTAESKWRIARYTHFRMVLRQAGYPLRTFIDTRELFDGARVALEALDSAYEKRKRLHRDVSIDNIVVYRSKKGEHIRGTLIDWEFSTLADEEVTATDQFRFGTWVFMSIQALADVDDFRHSIRDDMECILYVVVYGAVRYLPHKKIEGLGRWVYNFFDSSTRYAESDKGGRGKAHVALDHGRRFLEMFGFKNPVVHTFFTECFGMLGYESPGWNMKNLKDIFRRTCQALTLKLSELGSASTSTSWNGERTERDVSDYYVGSRLHIPGAVTSIRYELAMVREGRREHLRQRALQKPIETTKIDRTSRPENLLPLDALPLEEIGYGI